ncbi:MAG: hypothetical protein EAX87_00625 [Candidatus Thorarchaeota archaeon]|nr:hypothetical protein [Candidatus Thorarchaeota archaeon]
MNSFSLKEKYAKAEATLRGEGGTGEVTVLIHRTPWLRILLVNNQDDDHSLSIEVEISIPDSNGKSELKSSELIDTLSKHLLYLQQLRDSGFELSVIGTGCIYCASLDIDGTPKDNLFRALIPP